MADIATFVQGLAGKAAAKKPDAKVLQGFPGKGAVEGVLAARKGSDKDDAARIAYEKARTLYKATIDAALHQGGETPGALASKVTQAESATSWDDWKAAGAALAEAFDLAKSINASRKKAWADARAKAMETVSQAMGLTEIGGGAVASGLAAADALAAAGKWHDARVRLDGVAKDAAKVAARAP